MTSQFFKSGRAYYCKPSLRREITEGSRTDLKGENSLNKDSIIVFSHDLVALRRCSLREQGSVSGFGEILVYSSKAFGRRGPDKRLHILPLTRAHEVEK